jgi:hypothetical protein
LAVLATSRTAKDTVVLESFFRLAMVRILDLPSKLSLKSFFLKEEPMPAFVKLKE